MPFIRGRYHINAIAGEALEAAREAEAALLALEHDAEQAGGDEDAVGTTTAARPGRGRGQFIASRSRRRNWFPRTSGERSVDLWRMSTGRRRSLRAEPLVRRPMQVARQVRITGGNRCAARGSERILGHRDRFGPDNCQAAVIPRVRRRTCLRITAIWLIFCEMSLRNSARASASP